MSIINHIVDYFTLLVISCIACKKESNNRVRDLIIIVVTVALTCINCTYNPKIQPIQLIISIVSCVIINKINVTDFIQVGLLYFLMSVLQSYVFTVLTIWGNGVIVKFYNLIGCALLILISFGILDLRRYNANGQKSTPIILFLLVSVCIEGLTMAAIKSIVNRYDVVLNTLEKFTLTLSFPIIMILMFLYYGGDALKLTIKQNYKDETSGYWHVYFELKNVSDITIYNPSVNYSGYSEFMYVKEMTVTYPNGITETIPWENGKADKTRIQRFLPAFLKEGESDKIELKPGESITGYYSASLRTSVRNGG